MKKFIITEEQNRTITIKLKSMVKQYGWVNASKAVGGFKNLGKLGFNNDPIEFLYSLDNMDVIQSEKNRQRWILYRTKNGNTMMIYDMKNDHIYVDNILIWLSLEEGFGLNYSEIQEIIVKWLDEVYDLKRVTPKPKSIKEFSRYWGLQ
jgi:hypothetical protein